MAELEFWGERLLSPGDVTRVTVPEPTPLVSKATPFDIDS